MTRETNERLLAAVQRGSAEEVRGILKSREPADWYAALKLSISQNRLEIVQILLQYGADPNHAYEGGMTPLILAVMNGNREIIENLIRARARVGDADSRGLTALHHACYSNTPEYEDIAAILLKAGAGYDRADQMGDTPLHIAASKGCVGLVVLLVSAGATMNRSNARGKTPLEVAVDARLSQVAETLLRAGSPFSSKLRTELEEMFGKEDLQKILASTPAAKEDARRRAEHTQELFEQFRVSFTEPWKWSEEVVAVCWCKNVGIEEHGSKFAGINGKRLLKEVDEKWLVDHEIPPINAKAIFEYSIEPMRKSALELQQQQASAAGTCTLM